MSIRIGFLRTLQMLVILSLAGCAVSKAMSQPGKKNLSVFSPGVPRSHLVAEVGPPVSSEQFGDGRSEDVFRFRQGYSKQVRVGRAVAHGAADLATGFIWELAGTPIEMIADGTEVQVVVVYDQQRNVQSIEILEGEKAFREGAWSSGTSHVALNKGRPGNKPLNTNPLSNPEMTPVGGSYVPAGAVSVE